MLVQPKAVVFDFDGVLVFSEAVNIAAGKKTFHDLGSPLTDLTEEEIQYIPGRSSLAYIPKLLASRGIIGRDSEIIAENRKNYDALWDSMVSVPPQMREDVLRVKALDIPIAIATTNRRAVVERFLVKYGMHGIFNPIITSEEVTYHKPHPEVYLKATQHLGVPPEVALAIEDTEVGVQAAKTAGLQCAAIPNEHSRHGNFSQADVICGSLYYCVRLISEPQPN